MSYVNPTVVTFNGINLTTVEGLNVLTVNPYEPPKRTLNTFNIARTDKSKVAAAFYTEKNIIVRVNISRATRDLMETSIDSLMAILHTLEAPLVVKQSLGNRRYTATLGDTIVNRDGGAYAEIDLIFKCSDRFGYDLNYTLLLQVNAATARHRTDSITLEGSAPTQAPLITVTVSAVSGGTGAAITIKNDATTQAVTVSRDWIANDVLEIDCLNRTVKVNGVEVAYTGAIPEWSQGTGYITYGDTFVTSRTYTMNVKYLRRWS